MPFSSKPTISTAGHRSTVCVDVTELACRASFARLSFDDSTISAGPCGRNPLSRGGRRRDRPPWQCERRVRIYSYERIFVVVSVCPPAARLSGGPQAVLTPRCCRVTSAACPYWTSRTICRSNNRSRR
ncbi:hypothetical protein EVAR_94448_1 [Eumeta japonica]|uniref:Uncharacterized protein n=1 Tax=Eumeta variegata TaxID=151549 RepID=A0A4C1ZRN0_EUMVA|nr:hypothetical protein EVAR_94448_1 [Eumeta japonica]